MTLIEGKAVVKACADNLLRRIARSRSTRWLGERTAVALGHSVPDSRLAASTAVHWRRATPTTLGSRRWARLHCGAQLLIYLEPGQDHMYYLGVHEPATTRVLLKLLRRGDIVIDAGANVGYFSVIAASRGAIVHAFEPDPRVLGQLCESIARNGMEGSIIPNGIALGAEASERRTLYLPDGETGRASLMAMNDVQVGHTLEVPVTSLDAYCRNNALQRVRVLKIDVEGSEAAVLRGAEQLLQSEIAPDALICEISGQDRSCDPDEVLSLLRRHEYRPYVIKRTGVTELSGRSSNVTWGVDNLLFTRPGRLDGADFDRIGIPRARA